MTGLATIILAFLCLGSGVYALLLMRRSRRDREVIGRLGNIVDRSPSASGKLPRLNAWPDSTLYLPEFVRARLYQAGIEFPADRLTALAIFTFCLWVAVALVFGFFAATLLVVSAILVGAAFVDYRARQRMNALSEAMLGYFDRVRQLLVVGNSLSVALARATQSSPPIIVEFFAPTMRRIANGAGITESMNELAEELDVYELRLFGTAIETNLRFGGSLTSILSNLIENIRRRAAVIREMRVSTSQIRASAWVLGLLPMVVASVVMLQSPDYVRWFIDNPSGRTLLVYCVLSQVLGAFMMRTVVKTTSY